jgi:hypothetical protein
VGGREGDDLVVGGRLPDLLDLLARLIGHCE